MFSHCIEALKVMQASYNTFKTNEALQAQLYGDSGRKIRSWYVQLK